MEQRNREGQLFGNYRLERRLGRGGFAEVYLGTHQRLHRQAAIKVLHTSLSEQEVAAFQREAEIIAALDHPHIVRILDFDVQDNMPFLVMDYLPNGTLRQRHPHGSQIPLSLVVSYVKQVADALQYAHDQRLIHRDVKPENMLVGRRNEIVLSDFGIAGIAHSTNSMTAQGMVGTIPYMAPEQIQEQARAASDQYALGTVVYEWLCGERPFSGSYMEIFAKHLMTAPPPPRQKLPTLPVDVELVIMTALEKDPKNRFGSIRAFATALENASQAEARTNEPAVNGVAFLLRASPNATTMSDPPPLSLPEQPVARVNSEPVLQKPGTKRATPVTPLASPNAGVQETQKTDEASSQPLAPSAAPEPATQAGVTEQETIPLSDATTPPIHAPVKPTGGRRRTFVLVGLALLVVLVLGASGLWYFVLKPAPTATTAMFGFNPAHTRYDPDEHTLGPDNIAQLTKLWSYTTGGNVASSPAVADGMVYVGSEDSSLYVFDASCRSACQPLWTFNTSGAVVSSPAVAGGMVYVGSEDSKLYVFDASCRSACEPLWSFSTNGELVSSPVIANGIVYIGSGDDQFYAFNAACRSACKPLWSFSTNGHITSSATVAGGVVYIGSEDDHFYAFDASCRSACQPLWSFETGDTISASAAAANGLVYVASHDNSLYAFDTSCRSDCQPLWSFATDDILYSSPAVANGLVYVGSQDNKLYAFDASCRSDCQPLWTFTTGDTIYSSPTIANGLVYVGSEDGRLYIFNASCRSACQPLKNFPTAGAIFSSAVVANGIVYLGSNDKNFYALGLPG